MTMSRIFKENMSTWTDIIELADLVEMKLYNATNYSNYTVKLYGHKSE